MYVHDAANQRIRKIGPDGIINTIAGNGAACGGVQPDPQCNDGAALGQKIGLATSGQPSDDRPGRQPCTRFARRGRFGAPTELYKIGTDGLLRVIGGDRDINPGAAQSTAEGIPAIEANFNPAFSSGLCGRPRRLVSVGDTYNSYADRDPLHRSRGQDAHPGRLGSTGFGGDGGPARAAKFGGNPYAIGFAPDRTLVIVDGPNFRLRRLEPRFPGFSGAADFLIPASDGGTVYRFDQAWASSANAAWPDRRRAGNVRL